MKRYLKEEAFQRVLTDFEFLFKRIRKFQGELDLRLRDGYFNLYYKGNSLAKVAVNRDGYVASIHKKFATEKVFRGDRRFDGKGVPRGTYLEFQLPSTLLHPFFQKKYLDRLCSNIARVGYSEEITFEQMLITDNLDREDFIIIDRQVTETAFQGKKIDLLGLRQQSGNKFLFNVIEVKLGKNPELRGEVAKQINGYLDLIQSRFQVWKEGYEETYRQMKHLGLFEFPTHEQIEILPGIKGLIVVGWYSGIARESIEALKPHIGDIEVKLFANCL